MSEGFLHNTRTQLFSSQHAQHCQATLIMFEIGLTLSPRRGRMELILMLYGGLA